MSENDSGDERTGEGSQVEQWYDEFAESPLFSGLTEEQKENAGFVVGSFSDYMESHQGAAPGKWREWDLEEVCLEILPRKVSAEEDYFRAVGPVLSAFFRFLEERGYQKGGAHLAQRVESLSPRIIEAGSDPSHWGMAKSVFMLAKSRGVDPENQEQMNHFIADYNRIQSLATFRPAIPGLYAPAPARKPRPELDRYAPCPCGSGKKYKWCCYQQERERKSS